MLASEASAEKDSSPAQPTLLTRLYSPADQVSRARDCIRAFAPAQVELDLRPGR